MNVNPCQYFGNNLEMICPFSVENRRNFGDNADFDMGRVYKPERGFLCIMTK